MDASLLSLCHHTVGLGTIFHPVDLLLPPLQSRRFLLRQLPAGNALINPPLLISLPPINPRCVALREDDGRKHDNP